MARAADVTLAWDDDQTTVTWNVYEEKVNTQGKPELVKLGNATQKTFTVTGVEKGRHTYVVRAEEKSVESFPSDPATLPAGVTNVRITVTFAP